MRMRERERERETGTDIDRNREKKGFYFCELLASYVHSVLRHTKKKHLP